jgi:hypothetical protein
MTQRRSRPPDVLAETARLAKEASRADEEAAAVPVDEGAEQPGDADAGAAAGEVLGCRIRVLPGRLHVRAAEVAARHNPVNVPLRELLPARVLVDTPQFLTLVTTKYWGPSPRVLTVSFLESTAAELRTRILLYMNAWAEFTCISFRETSGTGDVRISRGSGGYYSYLGTDITLIPRNRQTMNLQGFTMSTPESEYRRVVSHETGHTLGFPHEHMRRELVDRIDPDKAYAYFLDTQGWPKEVVDQQVLTPLDEVSILGTPADEDSIMCYQLPGEITVDGRPIRGGVDINASDRAFAAMVYPKAPSRSEPQTRSDDDSDDWDPSEDVSVPA